MAYYEVIVQHASGSAAKGKRVVLGGTWGQCGPEYTDSSGKAVLEHSASSVTVYVDGKDCGTARPGRFVVTL